MAITTAASATAIGGSITTRTVAGPDRRGKRVRAAGAGHNAGVHPIAVAAAGVVLVLHNVRFLRPAAIQVVPALVAVLATWLLP